MRPVLPEELSALLDGELDAARATEVTTQIAQDPVLREALDALRTADASWRVAAGMATFMPDIRLPGDTDAAPAKGRIAGGIWQVALTLAVTALITLRIALKLAGSDAWAFGLPMASLLLLIGAVIWLARLPPAPEHA